VRAANLKKYLGTSEARRRKLNLNQKFIPILKIFLSKEKHIFT